MIATMHDAVEVVIEDTRWQEVELTAIAQRTVSAVLKHLGLMADGVEIAVLGTDDARIAVLNADFRGKPQPTNVLSWPSQERGADEEGGTPDLTDASEALGDIALAYDTCLSEAKIAGKSFADHVTHLVVHGVLHLLGYDHIRDGDATLMEQLETEILASLGIADPYS